MLQFSLQINIEVWQDITWDLGKEPVPGYGYEINIAGDLPQPIQVKGGINQDGAMNKATVVDFNLHRAIQNEVEKAINGALEQQRQLHQG